MSIFFSILTAPKYVQDNGAGFLVPSIISQGVIFTFEATCKPCQQVLIFQVLIHFNTTFQHKLKNNIESYFLMFYPNDFIWMIPFTGCVQWFVRETNHAFWEPHFNEIHTTAVCYINLWGAVNQRLINWMSLWEAILFFLRTKYLIWLSVHHNTRHSFIQFSFASSFINHKSACSYSESLQSIRQCHEMRMNPHSLEFILTTWDN